MKLNGCGGIYQPQIYIYDFDSKEMQRDEQGMGSTFFSCRASSYLGNGKRSSPVQRDLGILLCLHRFLIFASCDWCHNVSIQSVDCLIVENKNEKRRDVSALDVIYIL